MPHDMPLLTTIALGLSVAFLCGLAASKLRLSPIVGYLIAGILVGPHTPGYIADIHIAEQLAEMGIVLLMFGVGLHFSIKDLIEVRKIALPGALVQISAATLMGLALAHYLGWSLQAGLLFGLACSVASTVVLLRALEDHHLLHTANGRIAIGWLVVEDLVTVLTLVLLPTFAVINWDEIESGGVEWREISMSLFTALAKIGMFVAFMLLVASRVLPWLLNLVASTRSRELFTLASFAIAVGVAYGAGKIFDVSLALGAFFAGMMLRESNLSKQVAERALPFQDAFAVLFFVSVGMLFNPDIIFSNPLGVLLCVLIIMVGKSVAAFVIVTLFRYPLKTGLLVSAGLSQIGEFSFILATLGVSYGVLETEARDIILAGALITIALNPVTFFGSRLMYLFIKNHPRLRNKFDLRDDDPLAHLVEPPKGGGVPSSTASRKTILLVGASDVATYICHHLDFDQTNLIMIESNRERVESLREQGFQAIAGDAGSEETLKESSIDQAVAIIIVIPDALEIARIIGEVRRVKPDIKIIVKDRREMGTLDFIHNEIDLHVKASEEIGRRIVDYIKQMT